MSRARIESQLVETSCYPSPSVVVVWRIRMKKGEVKNLRDTVVSLSSTITSLEKVIESERSVRVRLHEERDRLLKKFEAEEERVKDLLKEIDGLRDKVTSLLLPVKMLIWCPVCHARHIDEEPYAVRPHKTHACQSCGLVFRVSDRSTVGVQFLPGCRDAIRVETVEE